MRWQRRNISMRRDQVSEFACSNSALYMQVEGVPKTDVFVRCSRGFLIGSPRAVKVDSEVAMSIVGKPVCTSHSNCRLEGKQFLLKI